MNYDYGGKIRKFQRVVGAVHAVMHGIVVEITGGRRCGSDGKVKERVSAKMHLGRDHKEKKEMVRGRASKGTKVMDPSQGEKLMYLKNMKNGSVSWIQIM